VKRARFLLAHELHFPHPRYLDLFLTPGDWTDWLEWLNWYYRDTDAR